MKITKSFQYDDLAHPKIHKWITGIEAEGKNFSAVVRRLIETNGMALDTLSDEIEDIKKQIITLQKNGVIVQVKSEELEKKISSTQEERQVLKVGSNFVRNRYFNEEQS